MSKALRTKKYKKGERPAFYADSRLINALKKAGEALRAEEARMNRLEVNGC